MTEEVSPTPIKRDRSPSFPYIGLGKALERTQTLFDKVRRHEARVADIAKDWGLTAKSSSLDRNVAALLLYGLIEDNGSGDARKIRVSDMGLRILEDKRPGVREKLLGEAALKPKIIQEYAQIWKGGRPDEAHSLSQLKFEGGFTDEGARIFLRVFDETIRFASPGDSDSEIDIDPRIFALDGASETKHVRAQVSDDRRGGWVEGDATGSPMDQVHITEKAPPPPVQMPPPSPSSVGASAPLVAGEREWLRGPLSKDTAYRLVVIGEMGPKEIGKLIKLLEAQRLVLSDDDGE